MGNKRNFNKYVIFFGYIFSSLGFLYSYFSLLSLISLYLNFKKIKLDGRQILTIGIFIVTIFFYISSCVSIENMFISLRYYFGFLVFYMLLFCINQKVSTYYLYLIFIIIVFVELILSHQTFYDFGYRSTIGQANASLVQQFFGFYERPVGITTNPTMSSSLGLILFQINLMFNPDLKRNKIYMLSGFLIPFVFLSATALLLLFIIIFRYFYKKIFYIIIGAIVLLLYSQDFLLEYYPKLALESLYLLVDYKINNFSEYLQFDSLMHLIFGNVWFSGSYPLAYNDIGWLAFFSDMGFLGSVIYFLLVIINLDKKYILTIFLMFIANWHYPAIFSHAGNLLLAMVLQKKLIYDYQS